MPVLQHLESIFAFQVNLLLHLLGSLFPRRPGKDGEPCIYPFHKTVLDWCVVAGYGGPLYICTRPRADQMAMFAGKIHAIWDLA